MKTKLIFSNIADAETECLAVYRFHPGSNSARDASTAESIRDARRALDVIAEDLTRTLRPDWRQVVLQRLARASIGLVGKYLDERRFQSATASAGWSRSCWTTSSPTSSWSTATTRSRRESIATAVIWTSAAARSAGSRATSTSPRSTGSRPRQSKSRPQCRTAPWTTSIAGWPGRW